MAKVVVVIADGELTMLVLPADRRASLSKVRDALGAREVRFAEEHDFANRFADCELGAMPPFGNLYGVPIYADSVLAENQTITFQAGSHTRTISLKYSDYERLASPTVVDLAMHLIGHRM
jgi:Ala-tRNA(Pro) deacylase